MEYQSKNIYNQKWKQERQLNEEDKRQQGIHNQINTGLNLGKVHTFGEPINYKIGADTKACGKTTTSTSLELKKKSSKNCVCHAGFLTLVTIYLIIHCIYFNNP